MFQGFMIGLAVCLVSVFLGVECARIVSDTPSERFRDASEWVEKNVPGRDHSLTCTSVRGQARMGCTVELGGETVARLSCGDEGCGLVVSR